MKAIAFEWVFAARELVAGLALPAALRKTAIENKILSDIIAACIYVCSALAIFGFVFALRLRALSRLPALSPRGLVPVTALKLNLAQPHG